MLTKVLKILRMIAALFLGLFFTVALGLATCLLGLVSKIFCAVFKCPNLAKYMFNLWSFLIEKICVQGLLSVKTMTVNGVEPASDNEIIVCIGNHPSTLGIATFTYFVHQHFCKDILAIAKKEHLWNPFIGWPLWLLDSAIFVNRWNPSESKTSVDRGVARFLRIPSAIIIFPDMRRPSSARIAKDKENFAGKIPNVRDWLNYTLVPRGGGLYNLLKNLGGENIRVVNITMACDRNDGSVLNLFGMFGARFYISAEEVDIKDLGRESLNQWLNCEWTKKNRAIDFWKNCKIQ